MFSTVSIQMVVVASVPRVLSFGRIRSEGTFLSNYLRHMTENLLGWSWQGYRASKMPRREG
jgi:hypothetical protein